jgi:hypothetical protein
LAPVNEGTVLAALDDILPFPDLALVLLESIAVVAVTRFVDKLLEEQGGDALGDSRAVRSVNGNRNVSAARRADRSKSIDDTMVQ